MKLPPSFRPSPKATEDTVKLQRAGTPEEISRRDTKEILVEIEEERKRLEAMLSEIKKLL